MNAREMIEQECGERMLADADEKGLRFEALYCAAERVIERLILLRDDPYLTDCLIKPREGENVGTMFRGNSPHLRGYAILPKEEHELLQKRVEEMEKQLEMRDDADESGCRECLEANKSHARERYRDRLDRAAIEMYATFGPYSNRAECVHNAKVLLAAIDDEVEKREKE